jgi:glycosyltransferase involved in cell wall biosynthesis
MTDKVKISVVIPTRSRATYLKGCLQSVLIAAGKAECPVEIIVADNASSDETRSVVAGFNSPLITCFRQPERVSMRQNFEDGLSCCPV